MAKKFIFKFEKTLSHKERIEKESFVNLKNGRERLEIAENEKMELLNKKEEILYDFIKVKEGKIDIQTIQMYNNYLLSQEKKIIQKIEEIENKIEEVKELENIFFELRKEKKAFEKLKEKHFEEYKKKNEIEEQKIIDEISNNMYNRGE